MGICYIGIGSNLGKRETNIDLAIQKLKETNGCFIGKISPLYETEPEGAPKQEKFLNAAVKIKTELSPQDLLGILKKIETDLGRKPSCIKWSPRTIDLDILLYDDMVLKNKDLVIPHPSMHKRWFVLKPLSDIAKDAIHPVLKKNINQLLKDLGEIKC